MRLCTIRWVRRVCRGLISVCAGAVIASSLPLSSFGAEKPFSIGTGFIISPSGYVLSSRHVVENADRLEIILSNETKHAAKLVLTHEKLDLAVLKIEGENFPAAALGDSDKMGVTDYVMAIGYPLADILGGAASAYEGKINALRTDQAPPKFQFDATINPGHSGGPLVNERGEVIAVIESKVDAGKLLLSAGFIPERINFAIPINAAKPIFTDMNPPLTLPESKNEMPLEPKAIFSRLSPSVVQVLNYRSRRISDHGLTMLLPGMSIGVKPLDFASIMKGEKQFFIGIYEVTQAQYMALLGRNPSRFKLGPDYPVESVSWEQAKEFCSRLTALVRSAADEAGAGWPEDWNPEWEFRLPTDEEWSWAVGLENEVGPTPQEKHRKITGHFPWGTESTPTKIAGNYADQSTAAKYRGMRIIEGYEDGYAETAPVGSFRPNEYGLHDLGGNVWEWCEDWLNDEQKQRVVRGASWRNGPLDALISSHRASNVPNGRFDNIGFRIVLGKPIGN